MLDEDEDLWKGVYKTGNKWLLYTFLSGIFASLCGCMLIFYFIQSSYKGFYVEIKYERWWRLHSIILVEMINCLTYSILSGVMLVASIKYEVLLLDLKTLLADMSVAIITYIAVLIKILLFLMLITHFAGTQWLRWDWALISFFLCIGIQVFCCVCAGSAILKEKDRY